MFHVSCHKAFSFIESMLAVFLVSVGLLVALQLLTLGLKNSLNARDQFIASLLAQEGIEIVRNIRDNAWVDNNPDTTSFSNFPATSPGSTCLVSYDSNIFNCSGAFTTPLYSQNNYYTNTGGSVTKFRRMVLISLPSDTSMVTSMVLWGNKTFSDITCSDYNTCITNLSKCNSANQCSYTQITLNKWGE
jgi:Tfp pilus assembly protein PilV